MGILVDHQLRALLPYLVPNDDERDESLINPASLDIRVGAQVRKGELLYDLKAQTVQVVTDKGRPVTDPEPFFASPERPGVLMLPGDFALVSCYERIHVPNDMAMDLRLKSSRAREGWNHSLAFWVDPGWDGYLTMELQNVGGSELYLVYGQRMAQVILHVLHGTPDKPYAGRYQGATGVEGSKG